MEEKKTKQNKEKDIVKHSMKDSAPIVIKITLIFLIPALFGTIVGTGIDNLLNIKPYGTLIVLLVFYVLSWILILKTVNTFKKS